MARKDSRHTEGYKEIERLGARLYKAKKELLPAKGNNSRNMDRGYIDDLKSQIAWLLLDAGEYKKGLVLYRTLPWRTHGEEKYNGMARALIETGYYDDARRLLEKGLSRFPESLPLLVAMGLLHRRLDDDFEALRYFEHALKLDPADKNALFDQVVSLNGLGYYEDAAPILKDLIENDPDDPDYLIEMGYIHLCRGYPEKALPFYKKAQATGCLKWTIYDGLFWAYFNMDLKNDTIEIASEGIRKLPDSHSCLYENLSRVYSEMGWINEAKGVLKKGLEIFPDDENLKKLLKEIEDDANDPDKGNKPPILGLILLLSAIINKLNRRK